MNKRVHLILLLLLELDDEPDKEDGYLAMAKGQSVAVVQDFTRENVLQVYDFHLE